MMPGCSRCIVKGIECCYPAKSSQTSRLNILQYADDVPIERENTASRSVADFFSVESLQNASGESEVIFNDTSDPDFANLARNFPDWDTPELDFDNFLSPQTREKTLPYFSYEQSSLVGDLTPSTSQTAQARQAISSNMSIPPLPSYTLRLLIQRPRVKTGAQRTANLILQTMKSYPLMILHHNTLPPFIHPGLISSDVENDEMEPLDNCINLVHMISSGFRGSRKLFWTNVRMECERLGAIVR